jgi:ferredoxin--NADP+ reductase
VSTAPRRLHLHFLHSPVEITGDGRVEGVRFERTRPVGDGTVVGTGEFVDYAVQAVYRAVGYASSPLPGVPFDEVAAVLPNAEGRVLDEHGTPLPGVYATGWIKRGPVGLIGHTKGDALETITHLVDDAVAGILPAPVVDADADVLDLLEERGVPFTTWEGWLALDAHERGLGESFQGETARERVKVVSRDEQVEISRSGALIDS